MKKFDIFGFPIKYEYKNIPNLPEDIEKIWKEINECRNLHLYRPALMLTRTLLFKIAFDLSRKKKDKKINEYSKFCEVTNYLKTNIKLPDTLHPILDSAMKIGNKFNHSLKFISIPINQEQLDDAVEFAGLLLEISYKFKKKRKSGKLEIHIIPSGSMNK